MRDNYRHGALFHCPSLIELFFPDHTGFGMQYPASLASLSLHQRSGMTDNTAVFACRHCVLQAWSHCRPAQLILDCPVELHEDARHARSGPAFQIKTKKRKKGGALHFANSKNAGSAFWTLALYGRTTVFQRCLHGIVYCSLLPAFHAVCFNHEYNLLFVYLGIVGKY